MDKTMPDSPTQKLPKEPSAPAQPDGTPLDDSALDQVDAGSGTICRPPRFGYPDDPLQPKLP